jgi:flagellin-like protein
LNKSVSEEREMKKERQAVSPVIGVMLLVVITVVIAAAVWLWLTTIIGGGAKTTPTVEMSATKEDNNYTISINSVSRSDIGLDKVKVFILKEGVSKDSFLLSDARIYGNKTGKLSFIDEDMRMTLTVGDYFKLREDYAESGIMVRLIYIPTSGIMEELTLG